MRSHLPTWIMALTLVTHPTIGGDEPAAAVRLRAMRGLAEAAQVVDGRTGQPAPLIPEPIYRFDDPTRTFGDGSIWAYGKVGRPNALLCLSFTQWDRNRPTWMHEFTALADGPVRGSSQQSTDPWTWDPKGSAIEFRAIPQAPRPGETEGRRLVQIKEIARRFKAFEVENPEQSNPSDRFELRLLPQPIHRYRDPEHGLIDGALFLLSYGRNPEITLLIEARTEGKKEPTWSYGLARMAGAELHVSLDDREVAVLDKTKDFGPTNPYFLFHRFVAASKD